MNSLFPHVYSTPTNTKLDQLEVFLLSNNHNYNLSLVNLSRPGPHSVSSASTDR